MFQNIYEFSRQPKELLATLEYLTYIIFYYFAWKCFRNRKIAFVSRASLELWFRSNVFFPFLGICLFAILPLFAFLLKLVLVGGGLVGRLLETSPDLWLLPFVHCLQVHPAPTPSLKVLWTAPLLEMLFFLSRNHWTFEPVKRFSN